jgi:hypothetical protein
VKNKIKNKKIKKIKSRNTRHACKYCEIKKKQLYGVGSCVALSRTGRRER